MIDRTSVSRALVRARAPERSPSDNALARPVILLYSDVWRRAVIPRRRRLSTDALNRVARKAPRRHNKPIVRSSIRADNPFPLRLAGAEPRAGKSITRQTGDERTRAAKNKTTTHAGTGAGERGGRTHHTRSEPRESSEPGEKDARSRRPSRTIQSSGGEGEGATSPTRTRRTRATTSATIILPDDPARFCRLDRIAVNTLRYCPAVFRLGSAGGHGDGATGRQGKKTMRRIGSGYARASQDEGRTREGWGTTRARGGRKSR